MSLHRSTVETVVAAARLLLMAELEEAIDAGERALAVGPIADATLFRERHTALEEDMQLLRKALPLWQWARDVRAKAEGGAT